MTKTCFANKDNVVMCTLYHYSQYPVILHSTHVLQLYTFFLSTFYRWVSVVMQT